MAKPRKVPQRMCVGCRAMKNKKELIRIVRTPDGNIEIDPTGKKAGRGAYICPDTECLERAIRGKSLQKALQTEVSAAIIADLKERLTSGFVD
ncbi:MAG TPA: YlxR family protein [Syntrophomonadaceae bacterium]|nr:YlxR family protein [Syntrophomonadaceae bacterium]